MHQTTSILREAIQSAFEHHQAGNFAAAEPLYRSVLQDDPENLNGLHLLGLLLHQLGRPEEALVLLEAAAALLDRTGNVEAAHAAVYNNLGNALRAVGRGRDARDCYDRGVRLDPDSAELHANLGNTLLDNGDWRAAVASYRAALRIAPAHSAALINLACILIEKGPPDEALAACRQLAAAAPNDPNTQFLLGRALGQAGDAGGAVLALQRCLKLDPHHGAALYWLGVTLAKIGMAQLAAKCLEQAVALRPNDPSAIAELGNVLQSLGDVKRAFACFQRVGELRPLTTWSATRRPPEFSVLAITSPGVANTPPEFLFANAAHDSHFFALLPGAAPDESLLRGHGDVVVNLISDADQAREVLDTAAAFVDRLGKPVVNHPSKILRTDRATVAARLAGIERCHVPKTARLERSKFSSPDLAGELERRGFSFPLLLRVPGSHGGEAFEKIDTPAEIETFLTLNASEWIYATRYGDYRSADGHYRKYRLVFTDEDILPYHLAIGEHWKVHHYTTNMYRHAWMQEEEERFLEDPRRVFSAAHYAAMSAIRAEIGLDFFGIDCSLDRDGNLLVFEVNASILIHNDNADFPYKGPACMRIKQAFEGMLRRAAAQRPSLTTIGAGSPSVVAA